VRIGAKSIEPILTGSPPALRRRMARFPRAPDRPAP
jgi:hypothetical protein